MGQYLWWNIWMDENTYTNNHAWCLKSTTTRHVPTPEGSWGAQRNHRFVLVIHENSASIWLSFFWYPYLFWKFQHLQNRKRKGDPKVKTFHKHGSLNNKLQEILQRTYYCHSVTHSYFESWLYRVFHMFFSWIFDSVIRWRSEGEVKHARWTTPLKFFSPFRSRYSADSRLLIPVIKA